MSVEILFLNDQEINTLAANDMKEVMHDVERTLSLLDNGDAKATDKAVLRWGNTVEDENTYGRINAMPSFLGGEYNMAGIKWIGSSPQNHKKGLPRASVTIVLNDPDTKLPVCISDGTKISAMRTGAKGGLSVRYLASTKASVLTILGAGVIGRTQLEAILMERPSLSEIYIYDIVLKNAQHFAEEMGKKLGVSITVVENQEEACRKSDIIVTATLANEPIVFEDWIKKGCLMMNISDFEFSYGCVKMADKIVVDTWNNIKHRNISTVALMYHEGLIKDEDVTAHLGEIINGKKTGRDNDDQIIYFNAVGMGIEDIAVATRGYRKALEQGVGTRLTYWV